MTRLKMIDLPPDLDRVRQRFERWRRTRTSRSRIPRPLWDAAVEMAGRYGIHRTARALRVDYYSLKERADLEAGPGGLAKGDGPAAFLELSAPSAGGCECLLELEAADGAKMRVQLRHAAIPDLAALARSFLGGAES